MYDGLTPGELSALISKVRGEAISLFAMLRLGFLVCNVVLVVHLNVLFSCLMF